MKVLSCFLGALLLGVSTAHADDERRKPTQPLLPLYQQECAACHLAYPPGMLPAASWRRILATLPRHYGSDASLDPASVAALSDWLIGHAGTYRRMGGQAPPEDRITRSDWFVREHDEVAAATWKRASVKSAANCAACHGGAQSKGDFNEHSVRIPK
jgi:mono/diheme cytochrome c family protein